MTFQELQDNCDIDTPEWREQYKLANVILHPSAQGTFKRLADMGTKDVILVGQSDYGITTPGEHSAISLVQISAMFFSLICYSPTIVAIGNMNSWVDVIRECYFKTHDQIFPDDEKLWHDSIIDKNSDGDEA